MIVLRIRLDGVTFDHRLEHGDATLGAGSRSTIRATNAGWPSLAATLRQEGTEVRMIVPGRVGTVTLRVGDEVRLGRADVSIVGLLPPEEEALPSAGDSAFGGALPSAVPTTSPRSPSPSSRPAAPVSTPMFGDYVEAGAQPFALEEPPRTPATSGSLPPPLPPPRAAADSVLRKSAAVPIPHAAASASASPSAARTESHASAPASAAASAPAATARTDIKPETTAEQAVASTWDGPQEDFSEQMFAQLKRTPWFAVSVAFHLLLFLLFRHIVTQVAPQPVRFGGGTLAGSLFPQQSLANDTLHPLIPEEQELLPPSPPAPEVLVPVEDPTQASQDPESMPFVLQTEPEQPPDLGTLPALSAAGRKTTPRSLPGKAAVPREDLREAFSKGTMHDARKRAARHVLDALGVDRGGPGQPLKTLAASEVLVVEGEWDHQERVLAELGIAHTKISPYDTALTNGSAFDQPRFVFWNCGDRMNPRHAARIGPRVRAFVEQGGYLFTSDWALDNVVKPAFPGYVDTRGMSAPLPEMVLDIAPTRAGAGHPLLEGVFQPGLVGRWWLEQASHDIVIKKTTEITVLIESPQLRDLLSRSPAMAFTFEHGKGRVLHILGHYDQEEGNIAGTVAVQRIALNFLLMGMNAVKEKENAK